MRSRRITGMIKYRQIYALILVLILASAAPCLANDTSHFRTVTIDTPKKSVLRLRNGLYYSSITANSVLRDDFGVTDPKIFSSITTAEFGITNSIALSATLPWYSDRFTQYGKSGNKSGGGDVVAGLRYSFTPRKSAITGLSLGARFMIPEEMTYSSEPLGFREFSTGEFGYCIETALGLNLQRLTGSASLVFRQFPNAEQPLANNTSDQFYDTGFGYRGIGISDQGGYAPPIFQDQLTFSFSAAMPVKSWLAGIMEFSSTAFIEEPRREDIITLAAGVRIGRPESVNASIGIDFGLGGQVPSRTFLMQLAIPTVSPSGLKKSIGLDKKPDPGQFARARNSVVAVPSFTSSDKTYLYERQLRSLFQKQLSAGGVLNVAPQSRVDDALVSKALAPLDESPVNTGVRFGSQYVIRADITEYRINRHAGMYIPLVISFPQTDFVLSARAVVDDLIAGESHDLGLITATIIKTRGVNFFPLGESSDITYLSEPERAQLEKELIDAWVSNFNSRIYERIDLFDWDPQRVTVRGDEDSGG